MEETNYKLVFGYDGTNFHGYSKQKNKNIRTVQSEVEHALSTLFNHDIKTTVAGRTDAGVHARRQCVNFYLGGDENCHNVNIKKINSLLPSDIFAYTLEKVPRNFNARWSAKTREYRYFLADDSTSWLVFLRNFVLLVKGKLNIDKMTKASKVLIGEHDFSGFAPKPKPEATNIRTIKSIELKRLKNGIIEIRFIGNAFARNMIRSIVGALIAVGLEKRPVTWVDVLLVNKKRQSKTVNSCGLVLWEVKY